MRKTVIAAAAAFAIASGAMIGQAAAADLDFMPAPPPPVFVPTWAGFYIGGHLGYGEADFDTRVDLDYFDDINAIRNDSYSFFNSLSADGLVGGIQGGYNWQINQLVLGIEADISFTDWSDSSSSFDSSDVRRLGGPGGLSPDEYAFGSTSADVDFLASVRGRLGFAMNNFLIYGTGGIAWADADASARVVVYDESTDLETTWTGKRSFNDIGFVVGAGMGWMVIPQTFSVGVEGLYYFFDQSKTLIDDTIDYDRGELDVRATASLDDAWVIRARADFHF
jgi:outer membrane immunogenic protein